MNRMITKYLVLLIVYTGITRIIERFDVPHGYTIYPPFIDKSQMFRDIALFQLPILAIQFVGILLIVTLMIVDAKEKKLIDWLIIVLTLLRPDIGIVLFIGWSIYKDWVKRHETQSI